MDGLDTAYVVETLEGCVESLLEMAEDTNDRKLFVLAFALRQCAASLSDMWESM